MVSGVYIIDFETFCKAVLKRKANKPSVGVYNYTKDPSFEPLCMGYGKDARNVELWVPWLGYGCPEDLRAHIEAGGLVEAHNYLFEWYCWEIMVEKHGWPQIKQEQWRCTMARCGYAGLPMELDKVGHVLDLIEKKDRRGKLLIQQLCQPKKPSKKDPSDRDNCPVKLLELGDYCMQDVATEADLGTHIPDLPRDELKLFHLDGVINRRGIGIDTDAVRGALKIRDELSHEINNEINAISGGDIRDVDDLNGLKAWAGLQSASAEVLDELLAQDWLDAKKRRVFELRRSGGMATMKKLDSMLAAACPDNRLRMMLQYHGATTGRWAARLVQLQNLLRPVKGVPPLDFDIVKQGDLELMRMLYDDPLAVISSSIRSFLCAGEGKHLAGCDYSGIESRVAAWCAGEMWKVKAFEDYDKGIGKDNYLHAADGLFGYTCEKSTHDFERQAGKIFELACGYQGWIGAFRQMESSYGLDLGFTDDRLKELILRWRDKHICISTYWKALEETAIEVVSDGVEREIGQVRFALRHHAGHRWLVCILPSGRPLWYFDPKVETRSDWRGTNVSLTFWAFKSKGTTGRVWVKVDGYGGLLFENIVQAIARDLLRYGLFRLEDEGWPVVLHVHDEAVAEVEPGRDMKEMEDIMCEKEGWAKGLPLAAEAWPTTMFRYGKH